MNLVSSKMRRIYALFALLVLALTLGGTAPLVAEAADPAPGAFADPGFAAVWNANDAAVAGGTASRSYFYGPKAWAATAETYSQAPGAASVWCSISTRRGLKRPTPPPTPPAPPMVSTGLLTRGTGERGACRPATRTPIRAAQPRRCAGGGRPCEQPDHPSFADFAGVATTQPGENGARSAQALSPTALTTPQSHDLDHHTSQRQL